MSWEDEIREADPGIPRALVYLERAQGRGSKNAAAEDIDDALVELREREGIELTLNNLLERYDLGWSLNGLAEAAARFAEDLEKGAFTAEEPPIEELLELFETEEPAVGALLDALRACIEGSMAVAAKELMRAIIINSLRRDRAPYFVGVDEVYLADGCVIGTAQYLTESFEVKVPL